MGEENRIAKLRAGMLYPPELSIERAFFMTESYKETEGLPHVIRRASALEKILNGISIHIEDGELIVGIPTNKRRAAMLTPEINCELYAGMANASYADTDVHTYLKEEEIESIREMLKYWKGKSLFDKWSATAPAAGTQFQFKTHIPGPNPFNNQNLGHCAPGYERVLNKGLNGLFDDVDSQMASLNKKDKAYSKKLDFLTAVKITLKATISFADRYSKLAGMMAKGEKDKSRRAELEKIVEICRKVPANPAGSFYEALQSMWFAYIAIMLEGWAPGIGFGRVDQYLYPFYSNDIKTGVLTKEKARELIALFYIKLNELAGPLYGLARAMPGYATLSNFTLGGITPEGKDAVNELTYLFLDAEKDVRLHAEELVIRVNKLNPDSYLMKAVEIARLLKGKLKFVGDDLAMKQLIEDGKPADFARDYVVVGCLIPTVPARSFESAVAEFLNMLLMLELALNNGVSRLTGEQMGPKTGDPRKFKSYGELWDAYKKQVKFLLKRRIEDRNLSRKLYADYLQTPFQSALFDGCLEKGLDLTEGATAPLITQSWSACGIQNIGDSLAAIKKLVFEEKKVTMSRLIDALDRNFEGSEDILGLIRSAPKFGNDNDYVDSIVSEVFQHAHDAMAKHKGFAGAICNLQAGAVTANLSLGKVIGATPDGRKASDPLAEGGVSPHQGRNVSGPTATLRSVAKLKLENLTGGSVLNMRFSPDTLKDDSKMARFISMFRTYFETGGYLVQFNIVSTEMLKDAQLRPEEYKDLLVRVATYSAYFIDLPKEVQDDIIARIEFE
jgi:choline trimethylamine-lyase